MLVGNPPVTAANPSDVQLFLEPPKFSYSAIALVTASAAVTMNGDLAEIEAEVLHKLKGQAASAGANGIIEIVREFIAGNTIISGSSSALTSVIKNTNTADNKDLDLIQSRRDNLGSVSKYYLLTYRGKAIKSN